jgi:hypothetical protein
MQKIKRAAATVGGQETRAVFPCSGLRAMARRRPICAALAHFGSFLSRA